MKNLAGLVAPFTKSVSKRIISLLFLFGVAPLVILATVFFAFYIQRELTHIQDIQKEIVERISSSISNHIEDRLSDLRLFVGISNLLNVDKENFDMLISNLLDIEKEVDEITIADLKGKVISKVSRYYSFTSAEFGSIIKDEAFVTARDGKIHIGEIEFSQISNLPQLRMTLPIRDIGTNKVAGVLQVAVNVGKMWELISSYRIGEQRYAYIVDHDGYLIIHKDIATVLQKKDLKHIRIVDDFMNDKTGISSYSGLNGDRVIGASVVIPSLRWGVIVEEPVRSAYRGLYLFSFFLVLALLLTVTFAIVIGMRFSFRFIVDPILRLQEGAKAIAGGEFDKKIVAEGTDELAQLADSFNIMTENLQTTTVSLDILAGEIEERKKAESALQLQEIQLRTVLESTGDGILAIDNAGRVIKTNWKFDDLWKIPPDLLEKGSDEALLAYIVDQLVDPDLFLKKVRALYASTSIDFDTILLKDGRIIERNSCPLLSEGVINGRVWSFRDITDRRQVEKERRILEDRLQQAEKMEALGTLAGGVAHDLNNVLGVVVGYAELLLNSVDEQSPLRPRLRHIMKGGENAAAIVQDLLTLARRGVAGREVLNMNKIIVDSQQSPELENLSSRHSAVKIKTDLDPDLLNISGSSVHLSKTIFNLVSNASEAMPKGGVLTIKTSNQYLDKPIHGYDEVMNGDYVVLSVSDTGEGIPAADLKRIFEPFYTKKVMGRSGTGLGLAVVWGTVNDHHGYINVQSEEGKGSIFTLYFPVTREGISAKRVAVSISEYMGHGESILVVDDFKGQRNLAVEMLRGLNYKVKSVSCGEEAVAYLKEHRVDLLVLDMIMEPGMDGLDTYRSALEVNPKQKAIIVSGFSETHRVTAALALGAGAYVRKPYVIEKLGLAVRKELDSSTS